MKEQLTSISKTTERPPAHASEPATWFKKFAGSVALYRETAREAAENGGVMPIEPPLSPQEIEQAYNRGYYSTTNRLLGEMAAAQDLAPSLAEQIAPAISLPHSGDNYPIAC